jgi:photosystem II stability/assembly factor-like uncharacterized protein
MDAKAVVSASKDQGVTWYLPRNLNISQIGTQFTTGVACTGSRMWASSYFNGVIRRSDTAGDVWWDNLRTGIYSLSSVEASWDGSTVVTTVVSSTFTRTAIGLSNNTGAYWSSVYPDGSTDSSTAYTDVAISANGQTILVCAGGGAYEAVQPGLQPDYLYLSKDKGRTWTRAGQMAAWQAVSMNSNATRFAAAAYNGAIYLSTDGLTWRQAPDPRLPTASPWFDIKYSRDGSVLIATQNPGYVWFSYDGGATWASKLLQ